MSLFAFLLSPLRMASPRTAAAGHRPPAAPAPRALERMRVTVAACEAAQAHQAVATCPNSRIECCLPWPADARVQLHISHPAGQAAALRRCLQRAVPSCDWGSLNPPLNPPRNPPLNPRLARHR